VVCISNIFVVRDYNSLCDNSCSVHHSATGRGGHYAIPVRHELTGLTSVGDTKLAELKPGMSGMWCTTYRKAEPSAVAPVRCGNESGSISLHRAAQPSPHSITFSVEIFAL
jgi:hypothetical protein